MLLPLLKTVHKLQTAQKLVLSAGLVHKLKSVKTYVCWGRLQFTAIPQSAKELLFFRGLDSAADRRITAMNFSLVRV